VPLYRTSAQWIESDEIAALETPFSAENAALLTAEEQAEQAGQSKAVKGSGNLITKEIKVADFSSVDAGHAFQVEIVKADSYSAKITTDDNLLPDVQVVKEGSTLRIGLNTTKSYHNGHFQAAITMPRLDGLNLSGASKTTIKGFDAANTFTAKLSGATRLTGELKADKITLGADGASTIELKGTARVGTLTANGASSLKLKEFVLGSANARLSGASKAAVNIKDKLDYNVSGASNLTYRGSPTIGGKVKTGASRVQPEK
jgi:hypothetical protein